MKQTKKCRAGLLAAAVFWLAVWQAAAMAIGQEVFLVSPIQAAGTLMELLPQADFWQRVGFSAGHILLGFALGVLTLLALVCLIRCILGPRISDRVLAINLIGTLTVIMVAVTVLLLGEGYLADIALVYAMLSFLAVILLSKVYTGIYQERKHEEALHKEKEADA